MTNAVGIDISEWQRSTPPLAGLDFVCVRASATITATVTNPDGTTDTSFGLTRDFMYTVHAAAVRKAGLVLIAYHFGDTRIDPATQANYFIAAAGNVNGYVLDVEGTYSMSQEQVNAFNNRIRALGKSCGLYMSEAPFYLTTNQDWNWVANWSKVPAIPWTIWQSRGSPLDLDTYNGTVAQLRTYFGATKPMPQISRVVRQTWTANGINGVLRSEPIRSTTPVSTSPAGTIVTTIAEYEDSEGNSWRLLDQTTPVWLLRYGPGIAPDHDWIAGPILPTASDTIVALTQKINQALKALG